MLCFTLIKMNGNLDIKIRGPKAFQLGGAFHYFTDGANTMVLKGYDFMYVCEIQGIFKSVRPALLQVNRFADPT